MIVLKRRILGQTFLEFFQRDHSSGVPDFTRKATYGCSFSNLVFKQRESPGKKKKYLSEKVSGQVVRPCI